MRDLIQVASKLEKKQMEDAKSKLNGVKEQPQKVIEHAANSGNVVSLPDGTMAMQQGVYGSANQASGALMGLVNELTNIQAELEQIDQINPNMIQVGGLQQTSNSFHVVAQQEQPQLQ